MAARRKFAPPAPPVWSGYVVIHPNALGNMEADISTLARSPGGSLALFNARLRGHRRVKLAMPEYRVASVDLMELFTVPPTLETSA